MYLGGSRTRTWCGANIRTDSYSGFVTISTSRNRNQHDPVLVPGVDSTLDVPGVVAELEPGVVAAELEPGVDSTLDVPGVVAELGTWGGS